MRENLNAPEPSQDHLQDTSEAPPRDPPSEPNEAQVHEPPQRTDPTSDQETDPDEPVNGETSS
jgi:hypothetical protein